MYILCANGQRLSEQNTDVSLARLLQDFPFWGFQHIMLIYIRVIALYETYSSAVLGLL